MKRKTSYRLSMIRFWITIPGFIVWAGIRGATLSVKAGRIPTEEEFENEMERIWNRYTRFIKF